jgi:hypothetical protein
LIGRPPHSARKFSFPLGEGSRARKVIFKANELVRRNTAPFDKREEA